MASSIVVLGSINIDLVVRSARLPQPGETVIGGEFYQAQGGKGANQAVAAARAALSPVTLLGAVGDDEWGRQCLASLAAENLDCRRLQVVPGASTGMALIMVDQQGENCISVASGANASLTAQSIEELPEEVFQGPGVFLACLEAPWAAVQAALLRAERAGRTTILNPAPASSGLLQQGILSRCHVLTPNETEAALLTEGSSGERLSTEMAARELRRQGARQLIITRGARGLSLFDEQGVNHIPAPAVTAVDTTAAGDAFNGALAVGLSEGRSLEEAARWAMSAAAIAVTRKGAQPSLPSRGEINSFHHSQG